MAMTTTSNPSSVANRLITYLSKKLLEVQVDHLYLDQFARQEDLPANAGSRVIRFFKPALAGGGGGQFSTAPGLYSSPTLTDVVHALSEGVAIANYRENDWTNVDATLKQYGAATKISDIVSMIDAYQPLKQNMDLMGRDAALHCDTVIRNALVGSTHPDGSTVPLTHSSNGANGCELFVTASGVVTNSGASTTNWATTNALSQANGLATRLFVLAAGTRLRTNKAPKLKKERYVCLLPPAVQHDLVRDSDYKTAFQGRGADGVYRGQLADIDGLIFVEHTNPFIENATYGSFASNGSSLVWSTMFLGAGAVGCPKLAGTKSPLKPQIFINDKPDKSDPLNQFLIAGWKAYYMAMGLDQRNIVVGRSKSTFL